MKIRNLSIGVSLMLLLASAARADLVVTVGNVNLAAGSSGYVPVYISSNDGDQIGATNFQFLITTGGATRLEFTSSPAPASDPTFSNPNYIFAGMVGGQPLSGDVFFSSSLGNASQTTVPNDTFSGGDNTSDFATNVAVTSNGTMLLAELPVTTLMTGLPPMAGDTFTISLVSANSSFTDSADDPGPSFTSNAGGVTITPATAVPLPKPLMSLLVLLGMLAIVSCFHRRAASSKI